MAVTEVKPRTEVGRKLEAARHDQGLTKEAWVEMLDVSKPAYLLWLTRSVDINYANVKNIAAALGVSVGDVYGWLEVDRAKGVWLSSRELVAA